ncbi:MAG: VCBS repeat-containing protein [Verrucomicrobia bacterium]|nr:VCBS repeat-containing protein [Verrucomicrobiota bacterium]
MHPAHSPHVRMVGQLRALLMTAVAAGIAASGLLLGSVADAAVAPPWQTGSGYRFRPLTVPPSSRAGFTLMPPSATGVLFSNRLSNALAVTNRVFENGSGVAAGDVDGDGRCDLFFCGMEGGNRLYRNLGDWRFEDITRTSGLGGAAPLSTGAVLADVDGDGDLDLLVNSVGGGTRLFLNDGRGRFEESRSSGLTTRFGSTSMALADIDGDGDLDLYVANYRTTNYKDRPPGVNPEARMENGVVVVSPADRFLAMPVQKAGGVVLFERGEPDQFYRNDGHGRFTLISWTDGTFVDEDGHALKEPPLDWGLSVVMRDFNGDGSPDIYVCNDFFYSPDRLWLNDGKGRFRAAPRLTLRSQSMSSMGIDVADINRDGFDDFMVVDMLSRDHTSRHRQRANLLKGDLILPVTDPNYRPEVFRNTLFLNRGDATYAEIARLSGVEATEWSWSCVFLDVDLDGYEDLLVTNGNEHDVLDADTARAVDAAERAGSRGKLPPGLLAFPRLATANLAFRNMRDLTFQDFSQAWGFHLVGASHGMVLADLDGDGDLDVIINNANAPATLYRNESSAGRIAVRLAGRGPNTQGIGARIQVSGGPVPQSQVIMSGGRYLGGDDPMRVFATGTNTAGFAIDVTWPDGSRSRVPEARPNHAYIVEQSRGAISGGAVPSVVAASSVFEDVSSRLAHSHRDGAFDDFERQPFLPFKLSHLGPGISWFDVDGDHRDDLIVAGGTGDALAVFRNLGAGAFVRTNYFPSEGPGSRAQTTVLGWNAGAGHPLLLAATSNYEDGSTNGALLRVYDFLKGTGIDGLRARPASPGPLAMADIDGDGDLDLFVGSRVVPGRYPAPAGSVLYRSEAGRFRIDFTNGPLLHKAGLVSGAVFTDIDGDGQPDLVLACDWGPLRVYKNSSGRFADVTEAWGLSGYRGQWNGVTAGDFDGDGRMDIIASNWGRNTKYQRFLEKPVRCYFGPGRGEHGHLLEAYFDPALKKYVPWTSWDDLSKTLPPVRERFDSYRSYGSASIEEILGPFAEISSVVEVDTLDTMVFLNRGGRFEAAPLPVEAQMSPAFGVAVADFDGDGNEDLFLAQNFFAVPPEGSRHDAGRGLVLLGDGQGRWRPLTGPESGVVIYGQQRGVAVCDFDLDGRVDIAVSQHGGETRLFRNQRARPGLRIELMGPAGNPTAIGATMRLGSRGRFGPAREIHSGSGFWSQDSSVQVLHSATPPDSLWIRWPGGLTNLVTLPANAPAISVDQRGRVERIP